MAFFRLELFNEKGKVVEMRHVQLSCSTVMQALQSAVVNKVKKDARNRGYGFRVKREDD